MVRRCNDLIEVRQGPDGPQEFLWRGQLWQINAVQSQWLVTGAWWEAARTADTVPSCEAHQVAALVGASGVNDLLAEQEFWRVEATQPQRHHGFVGAGVFDLVYEWGTGSWRMSRRLD